MVSNNSVSKISIESHPRSQGDSWVGVSFVLGCCWVLLRTHVSKQAHAETCQCYNGGSSRNKIPVDLLNAYRVRRVGAVEIRAIRWADACPTRLRGNVRVDRDHVGHSEEGCQNSSYLRKETTPFCSFGCFQIASIPLEISLVTTSLCDQNARA